MPESSVAVLWRDFGNQVISDRFWASWPWDWRRGMWPSAANEAPVGIQDLVLCPAHTFCAAAHKLKLSWENGVCVCVCVVCCVCACECVWIFHVPNEGKEVSSASEKCLVKVTKEKIPSNARQMGLCVEWAPRVHTWPKEGSWSFSEANGCPTRIFCMPKAREDRINLENPQAMGLPNSKTVTLRYQLFHPNHN